MSFKPHEIIESYQILHEAKDFEIGNLKRESERQAKEIEELKAEAIKWKEAYRKEYLSAIDWAGNHQVVTEQLSTLRAVANEMAEALSKSDALLRDLPNSGGIYGLTVMKASKQALTHYKELDTGI